MISGPFLTRRWYPDREPSEATPGCLLLVAAPVALVISSLYVYSEARYALYGRRTRADVESVRETRDRRYGPNNQFDVHYAFTDPATQDLRRGSDAIPMSWGRPGNTVEIEFVGAGSRRVSRIAGHRHYLAIGVFFSVLLAAMGLAVYFVIDAQRALRGGARRRSRRRQPGDCDADDAASDG